ncbi:MAG: hypothetical protein U0L91_02440 [Gemmiger sp.]|uniref:hypothetical protein n=1 Tax=Gemmiger sp. TaxID=2049027 RepID=UPI002E78DB56|nr:hypothetical protein [Gemmiger sp.]MEE0800120.1 hypothetical protein [Gemmiger sp.]
MKKNGFLTFVFACIPGAGQMYYGYMKRGLSLICYFCLAIIAGMIASPLVILSLIVWMYSFFDTYDLIRYLVAGDPKPDEFLFFEDVSRIKMEVSQRNKILGWGSIALGVWLIYDNLLRPVLYAMLSWLGIRAYWFFDQVLPSVIVAVILVYVGVRLLGFGGKNPPHNDADDLPPYQGQ